MPTNPPEPRIEPNKTQKVAKSVTRFAGRHTEAVTLAIGIVMGAAIVLLTIALR